MSCNKSKVPAFGKYKMSLLGQTTRDIYRQLDKANLSSARALLIPLTEALGNLDLLSSVKNVEFKIIGQVHIDNFSVIDNLKWPIHFDEFEVLVTRKLDSDDVSRLRILASTQKIYLKFIIDKSLSEDALFRSFELASQFSYFIEYVPAFDGNQYKSYQIARQLKKMNDIGIFAKKDPESPVWNPSLPASAKLEPLLEALWVTSVYSVDTIRYSIIIPTYNNKYFLGNVLEHLCKLSALPAWFEVLIIDDGSSDDSSSYIQSLHAGSVNKINIKYFYWPREHDRRSGDDYFRAGQARNFGASQAQGQHLVFLDSDILVPENFIEELDRSFETFDVIQFARWHIPAQQSNAGSQYSYFKSHPEQLFIEEQAYWGPLFTKSRWDELPVFWKYTCTYCLAIKKDDFFKAGRFNRTFVSYGFEDTDLGYRLYKLGKKFYLNKLPCLHLTPEKDKSEYSHSKIVRHMILSKSAKRFFLNQLDITIYDEFKHFMLDEISFIDLWEILSYKTRNALQATKRIFFESPGSNNQ